MVSSQRRSFTQADVNRTRLLEVRAIPDETLGRLRALLGLAATQAPGGAERA